MENLTHEEQRAAFRAHRRARNLGQDAAVPRKKQTDVSKFEKGRLREDAAIAPFIKQLEKWHSERPEITQQAVAKLRSAPMTGLEAVTIHERAWDAIASDFEAAAKVLRLPLDDKIKLERVRDFAGRIVELCEATAVRFKNESPRPLS